MHRHGISVVARGIGLVALLHLCNVSASVDAPICHCTEVRTELDAMKKEVEELTALKSELRDLKTIIVHHTAEILRLRDVRDPMATHGASSRGRDLQASSIPQLRLSSDNGDAFLVADGSSLQFALGKASNVGLQVDESGLRVGSTDGAIASDFTASGTVSASNVTSTNITVSGVASVGFLQSGAELTPAGTGEVGGMNRLLNGGAESGMTSWSSEQFDNCGGGGSTSGSSFSGSKSFYASSCGMVTQTVGLAPGGTYTLSARTRVNHACHSGDGSAGRLVVSDAAGNELGRQACRANNYDTTPNCNKWMLCWVRFTAPDTTDSAHSSVKVMLQAWGNTHSFLFDEVMLATGAVVPAYTSWSHGNVLEAVEHLATVTDDDLALSGALTAGALTASGSLTASTLTTSGVASVGFLQSGAELTPAGTGEVGGMNRLLNGGAESGMTSWSSEQFDNCGGGGSTSGSSFSGSKSFYASSCGMVTQTVGLAPGGTYTLSARTRVNHACHSGDGSAGRLVVSDAAGNELGRQACRANNYDTTPNCNKWMLCWVRFTAPDTTDSAHSSVKVMLQAWGNTHSFLFDEVRACALAIPRTHAAAKRTKDARQYCPLASLLNLLCDVPAHR